MKSASNLGFVMLVLAILGCSCPNLDDQKNDSSKPASASNNQKVPSNNKTASETPAFPVNSSSPSVTNTAVMLEKYNRIIYGMTYDEVVQIIGFEGNLIKKSPDEQTVRYFWGDDYTFIMITFMDDKVEIKSQNNLK